MSSTIRFGKLAQSSLGRASYPRLTCSGCKVGPPGAVAGRPIDASRGETTRVASQRARQRTWRCARSTNRPGARGRSNWRTGNRAAYEPEAPGGGEHRDHAGGGRRGRAAGDALLGRQGQLSDVAPGPQGLPSREAAVSSAAHRYDVEVPRDVRSSGIGRRANLGSSCLFTSTRRGWRRGSGRSRTARRCTHTS